MKHDLIKTVSVALDNGCSKCDSHHIGRICLVNSALHYLCHEAVVSANMARRSRAEKGLLDGASSNGSSTKHVKSLRAFCVIFIQGTENAVEKYSFPNTTKSTIFWKGFQPIIEDMIYVASICFSTKFT